MTIDVSIVTGLPRRPGGGQAQAGHLAVPDPEPDPEGRRLLELWLSRGTPPFDHGGEAWCHDSSDFVTLEREVADLYEMPPGTKIERLRRLRYVQTAAAQFCEGCPVMRQCREWAESDPFYEGIAAGKVVRRTVREWRHANGPQRAEQQSGVPGIRWRTRAQKWEVFTGTRGHDLQYHGLYADLGDAIEAQRQALEERMEDET